MASRIASLLVVASTLVLARAAHADDPDADAVKAKEIGARARALATKGLENSDPAQLDQAIVLYKEAFSVDPNPIYQCNAGVAYKLNKDLPRAHALLAQCLQRLPAVQSSAVAPFRAQLDEVEAALPERHVAVDVITAPAGAILSVSTLAEDERLVAPTVVWLPVGTHSIAATASGYQRTTEEVSIAAVDISTHAKKRVRLAMAEEVRVAPVAEPIKLDQPTAAPANNGRRTTAKVLLGAGVVLGAAGGVLNAVAFFGTKQDLVGLPDGPERDEKVSTLTWQRNVSYGLYGLAGAALVTGAILYYLPRSQADRVAIAPAPSGTGAVVWLDLSP